MLVRIVRSRVTVGVVCAALGATIVGGIAWAAIPSTNNGQISACYPTSGVAKGQLRVIDYQAGERCRAGEAPISWQKYGLRFRGAWASTTGYTRDDLVTDRDGVFVAIANNTARRPGSNPTYWTGLASVPPRCAGYPRAGVDWSVPGSTAGNGCDLRGMVLVNPNLSGANMRNANLSGLRVDVIDATAIDQIPARPATFAHANLAGANLAAAEMTNGYMKNLPAVDFTGAILVGANLTDSRIQADFTNADLTNAMLFNAYFIPSSVEPFAMASVWSNTTCPDGTNSDANGGSCDGHLRRQQITGDHTGQNLSGVDWRLADIGLFASLASANLTGANLSGAHVLAFTSLSDANLSGANLTYAYLHQTDLTGASLTGANLTGVTWIEVTCPDGTLSNTNGTSPQSCLGHLVP